MEIIHKQFSELTVYELFEIYKLRVSVFVVEQNCPYQEVDDEDKISCHVIMREGEKIKAYLRLIPDKNEKDVIHIGRVIAAERRHGLGTAIVSEGIRLAKEEYSAAILKLEAQVYAAGLYEKLGFKKCSDEFELDGIPHEEMIMNIRQ